MTDKIDTFVGECPECGEITSGDVHGDTAAGVYGWTCDECGTTNEPDAVPTAVYDTQRDALEAALVSLASRSNSPVETYHVGRGATDAVRVHVGPHAGGAPGDLVTIARGLGFEVVPGSEEYEYQAVPSDNFPA